MLRQLFSRSRSSSSRWRPASAPAGERIYAIGDVHGRLDLFDALLAQIEADDAARDAAKTTLILVGDYVDRGPDSAKLIAKLRNVIVPAGDVICLMGNHEQYMLASYDGDVKALGAWLRYGGWETLRSYGIADDVIEKRDGSVIDAMIKAVPEADIDFLGSLPLTHQMGDYLFVHAGILPGTPLESQVDSDMLWIRERFLDDDRDHGMIVVHGHTPREAPELCRNRINIDTCAYDSGRLTAVGLEGNSQWFIQTGSPIEPKKFGNETCSLINR